MTNSGEQPPQPSRKALVVVAAIFVIYAALSFYSDSTPAAVGLATGLSLGPVLLIAVVLVWRWTGWLLASILTLIGGIVLYAQWGVLEQHYQWSNLVQQCGAYALAAWGFVHSLSRGRVPLSTQVMEKMHGPLTEAETAYTRRATVAWAIFYVLLTIAILVLFLLGTMRIWSLFTNFGTYALMALMFAAEHLVRGRMLPRRPGGGAWAALRQLLGG